MSIDFAFDEDFRDMLRKTCKDILVCVDYDDLHLTKEERKHLDNDYNNTDIEEAIWDEHDITQLVCEDVDEDATRESILDLAKKRSLFVLVYREEVAAYIKKRRQKHIDTDEDY